MEYRTLIYKIHSTPRRVIHISSIFANFSKLSVDTLLLFIFVNCFQQESVQYMGKNVF